MFARGLSIFAYLPAFNFQSELEAKVLKEKKGTMQEQAGAIILAGGRSRRMGTNKALLRLEPGGPTLIEKVSQVLGEVTSEIILVTNQPELYEMLGLEMVLDNYPVGASLAGLEAGLAAAKPKFNLVVACDMPYLKPNLLRFLLEEPRDFEALVPRDRDGQLETLCAVYSKSCLPPIRAGLEKGQFKLAGWLDQVNTRYLPVEQLEKLDVELNSFVNLNTPEEFQQYSRLGK